MAILIIGSIPVIFFTLSNHPEDDIQSERTSIDSIPDAIPEEIRALITASLYNTIKLNDSTPPDGGAIIRNNTFNSTYDQSTNVHSGNFIVDINSIKQSYKAQFEWSDDKNNSFLSGYQVVITCLSPEDTIIFPDFNCVDIYHKEAITIDTFAEKFLPYTGRTQNYEIRYDILKWYSENGEPLIMVASYACRNQAAMNEVKTESKNWLNSKSTNINQDSIIYSAYCDDESEDYPMNNL